MDHRRVRELVTEGVDSAELHAHLAACPECREHADLVRRVRDRAVGLAPPPPPAGLTDRVVAAVRAGGPVGLPVAAVEPESPIVTHTPRSRWLVPASVAAAVLLLVATVSVVAVRGGGGEESIDAVLAASAQEIEGDSFRYTVEGTAELNAQLPDISGLVGDLGGALLDGYGGGLGDIADFLDDLSLDDLPLSDELREDVRERLDEFGDQMRRQLGALSEGLEGGLDDLPGLRDLELPDLLDLSLAVTGEGVVVAPDSGTFSGRFESSSDALGDVAASGHDVDLRIVEGETFLRDGDGWLRLPGDVSVLGPVPDIDGDLMADLLEGAEGEVEELGVEDVRGAASRHVRYQLAPDVLPVPDFVDVSPTVDVWVGVDDDLLRRVRFAGDHRIGESLGFATDLDYDLVIDLFDHGAVDEQVTAPDPGTVTGGGRDDLGPSGFWADPHGFELWFGGEGQPA